MTQDRQEAGKREPRKGGLGRGLAALIPTSGEGRPALGDSAADELFGPSRVRPAQEQPQASPAAEVESDSAQGAETSKSASKRSPGGLGPVGRSIPQASSATAPGDGPAAESASSKASPLVVGATYREIPVPVIAPNPEQPRQTFDDEPLHELAHSIREFGLMQPIVVRSIPREGRARALEVARSRNPQAPQPEFEIIMGERRWRAAQIAGLDTLPTIVRETDDSEMLRDALLENIHRVQLNPLEEAAAYQQLLEEFDVTQAQLAEKIGRSRPMITNMIRLLQLPVPVQGRVAAGVLSAGHARALLGLKTGQESMEDLAGRIVAEGLSVRATEEAVTLANRDGVEPAPKPREPIPQPERLTDSADRLSDRFDTKVTAQMGKKKGKIVIEFGDLEDFDRIMDILGTEQD